MNHKSDFHEDLKFGQMGEYLMGNFFINLINENNKKFNKNFRYSITEISSVKDWDFAALAYDLVDPQNSEKQSIWPNLNEPKLLVEVKTDKYKIRTGNLYIEASYKNGKSGISNSKSKWYIYFFIRKDLYPTGDNVFIFKTENLRHICNDYKNTLTSGGDKNKSMGYLIPINQLGVKYKDMYKSYRFDNFSFSQDEEKSAETISKVKKMGFTFE